MEIFSGVTTFVSSFCEYFSKTICCLFSCCCLCKQQKVDVEKINATTQSLIDLIEKIDENNITANNARRRLEEMVKDSGCCCKYETSNCCCCKCCCKFINQKKILDNLKDDEKFIITTTMSFFRDHLMQLKCLSKSNKESEGKIKESGGENMNLLPDNAKDTIDDIIKIIDNDIQLVEKATDSSYRFSLLKDTIRSLLVIIDNRKNIDWGLSDETLKCLVNFVNTKNTNDQSSKASSEVLILKNQI